MSATGNIERASPTPGPWKVVSEPYFHVRTANKNPGAASVCVFARDYAPEGNIRLIEAAPELFDVARQLNAFVNVMFGVGPECVIPETVTGPLGVPIKIGKIMQAAADALAKAGVEQ